MLTKLKTPKLGAIYIGKLLSYPVYVQALNQVRNQVRGPIWVQVRGSIWDEADRPLGRP